MPRKSKKLKEGEPAPRFALEDAATGETVTLESLLGRPVMIVFFRGPW